MFKTDLITHKLKTYVTEQKLSQTYLQIARTTNKQKNKLWVNFLVYLVAFQYFPSIYTLQGSINTLIYDEFLSLTHPIKDSNIYLTSIKKISDHKSFTSITKQMAAKQANVVKYEPMASANFPQHISPKLNFVKKYLKNT